MNTGQCDSIHGSIARDLQVGLDPGSLSAHLLSSGDSHGVELKVFLPGTASGGRGVNRGAAWLTGLGSQGRLPAGRQRPRAVKAPTGQTQRERLNAFSLMF